MKLNEELKLEEDVGGILGGKESLLKQPTNSPQQPGPLLCHSGSLISGEEIGGDSKRLPAFTKLSLRHAQPNPNPAKAHC